MRKILLVLVFFCVLVSCSEEIENSTSELSPPVCTGFAYRDANNVYKGSVGVPNNKLVTGSDHEWVLRVYPIPVVKHIQIEFDKPGKKMAWITAAETIDDLCENPVLAKKPALQVGNSALAFGASTSNQIHIDIPTLPDGPYRLYLLHNGELFWENILITDSKMF